MLKKFTAVLLAAVLALSCVPATVLANKQVPVNNLTITDKTTKGARAYTITLSWARPGISPNRDTQTSPDNDDITTDLIGYHIQYRNVSTNANGTFLTVPGYASYINNAQNPSLELSMELDPASVYEFRVQPYHNHRIQTGTDPNNNNAPIYGSSVEASVDTDPNFPDQRALYFTDLVVNKPVGYGSSVTVSWLAPRYGGQAVFNQYRFYWSADTDLSKPMDLNAGTTYRFSVDTRVPTTADYTLTSAINGTNILYTCTFNNNNLRMGMDYTMIVEPLDSAGALWRSQSPAPNPNSAVIRVPPTGQASTVKFSFAHTPIAVREFRSDNYRLRLPLYVVEESPTQVRIYWNSEYVGNNYPIYIYQSLTEGGRGTQIGYLGPGSTGINFWLTDKPTEKMWYYITLGASDDVVSADKRSEYASYDPNAIDFLPYKPDILSISNPSGNAWQITWEAFVRDIYNSKEFLDRVVDYHGDNKYIDADVTYNIWVSDSLSALDQYIQGEPVYRNVGKGYAQQYPDANAAEWWWSYNTTVSQYYNADSMAREPIVGNKVYYVKIVATRDDMTSEAIYGSFYAGPTGNLPTDPLMMAKPPLRVDSATETSIDISWKTQWCEVYNDHDPANPYANVNYPEGWYSSFGQNASGEWVYGEKPSETPKIYDLSEFTSPDDVLSIGVSATLPRRLVDITGSGYEIYVAEFDEVLGSSGDPQAASDLYLSNINQPGVVWNRIAAPPSTMTSYSITSSVKVGQIKANTAYVVFFRPISGSGSNIRTACYPVYVTATTPGPAGPINVTPITPTLKIYAGRTTATSITVYWEYTPGLDYTLAYSDQLSSYSSGGTTVANADLLSGGGLETIDGKDCFVYEVTGLFGLTEYYFWIRSAVGGTNSDWSNPVSAVTKDLDAPQPPGGLGLASKDVVDTYNVESSATLQPVASDYMIIQWMRNYYDAGTETTSTATGDVVRLDTSALMDSSYMAKFGTLVANRMYYVRAKTILTMTRNGGTIKLQYSYCVQLSETEDFEEYLEIYIPALDPDPANPKDMIRKESAWTAVLHFKTLTSSGEYDGEWDERLYPLPQSDFEITFNSATGELKYRFRSTGVAADGTHDNGVDQRFITRMIQDRVYVYELDMTKYNNYSVQKRTLEIPYSIVRAMDERKVSLRLVADNLTLTVSPGTMNTLAVNALKDYTAAASSVRVSLDQATAGVPTLTTGDSYVSTPQTLSVTVKTPTTTLNLTDTAQDLKLALKLANRSVVYDKNVSAYASNPNSAGWAAVANTYDNVTGTMSFTTRKVGTYAAIAKTAPIATDGSRPYALSSKLNITDLRSYTPTQPINASQFNNIVAAIARNKSSVAIYDNMSDADYTSLGKSGILVSGSEVSREAGINALVRLYELKTNAAVKNYGTVATTTYRDIANAAPQYQPALLKAAKLGFFTGASASPKLNLTMGDAFDMFGYILEDAVK